MEVTLNRRLALSVLRNVRATGRLNSLSPCEIACPSPAPAQRWTHASADLSSLGIAWSFTQDRPFELAVGRADLRVRSSWARNTVYERGLPDLPARAVSAGVSIVCPELLFVELAKDLGTIEHVLLGYELCGTYVRDAGDPRSGPVAYGVSPATSVARIEHFIDSCDRTWGISRARDHLAYVRDNAWSPMEAIIAAFAMLPAYELGYDLGPVVLNKRKRVSDGTGDGSTTGTRVPDLMFEGSAVGFNYEGFEHFDLERLVQAARNVEMDPGNAHAGEELALATESVRTKYVDDARRDRELGAQGLTVFRATKEDLYARGGLDRLMRLGMDALERGSGRELGEQRVALRNPLLAKLRQEAIWAMLPGALGRRSWRAMSKRKGHNRAAMAAAEAEAEAWLNAGAPDGELVER